MNVEELQKERANRLAVKRSLSQIIRGFNEALGSEFLPEVEKKTIKMRQVMLIREYEDNQTLLKAIKVKLKAESPTRIKKKKAPSLKKVDIRYQNSKNKKIMETHSISGFAKIKPVLISGGAPGLGKKR